MKQHAKLYREAARRILEAEEEYSCLAIAAQNPKYDGVDPSVLPEVDTYLRLYTDPTDAHTLQVVMLRGLGAAALRELRGLLLCMAAAIIGAGDGV